MYVQRRTGERLTSLTTEDTTGDGDRVLTLQALIRARMDERGWSYADLARRSGDRLTRSRWQQIGTGVRVTNFPEPANLALMADVLEVDVTTVLLAAAQTLGLDARRRGTDFAQLLPAGTDRLPEKVQAAVLSMIRALVAEQLAHEPDDGDDHSEDRSFRWSKTDAPTRRNAAGGVADTSA
jgi:transcriptional regulator with XRE-family HTH domain